MNFPVLLFIAVLIGMTIGWVDSRPNWDDTGVTVGAYAGKSIGAWSVLNPETR